MSANPSNLCELTNGHYRVTLSDSGAGASFLDWIALNRWADDAVENAHGFFIYLRDTDSGALWSAAMQPTAQEPEFYSVTKDANQFSIKQHIHEIESKLQVHVDPTDDVEVRRLTLTNQSTTIRHIEVTSCIEVALAHPMGDLGHPAFSKLFVQTELLQPCAALVAKRRPRSQGETCPAMFHAMSGASTESWQTDRLRFIGRGRSLADPAMVLDGTVGNVLDPLFSLRTSIQLQPGESHELTFVLGATADHNRVPELVHRHAPGSHLGTSSRHSAKAPVHHAQGQFINNGTEYELKLRWHKDGLSLPPMPWCNVIANERFGCLVSERGSCCTWSRNSQANRLTPWSNDPVCDPHEEALYLRDEATGEFWSPLPGPCPAKADYTVAHGFGYSRWSLTAHGLKHETTVFVARHDPIKITHLRLTNTSDHSRRLSLFTYQRLVLGTLPPSPGALKTWQVDKRVLCAQNTAKTDFSDGIAFSFTVFDGASLDTTSFGCDRRRFLGERGTSRSPKALHEPHLSNEVGGATDDCFAQQWGFELAPGQSIDCALVFGEAIGMEKLNQLVARYDSTAAALSTFDEVRQFWRGGLQSIRVQTPSPELDSMVNGWLAYQALSCRIWGRTAFYQSSGAFGFRDQLQDAGNLSLLWPDLTRRQLLLHARHQFVEGDVLHWWHEAPVNRGVRTRFSDDLLWLPFVATDYVRSTGDGALMDCIEPFLIAPLLMPGEDENYLQPEVSTESASLYEHCCRAIDRSLTTGAHGLPLMGTGDWNDGMNRVGREGKGESVWLGFFLYHILGCFIPLATQRNDHARAERYAEYRGKLHAALNDAGWDGEWYRRAFYDDGTILGTHSASECRIDGLAQAWSVISGVAPADRGGKSLDAAVQQLISEADGLIRLLTPPFVNTPEDPGYIKGYVAGVRENGGQYTHAACWMVQALAKQGRRDRAAKLMEMLSPAWHCRTTDSIERYMVEPYVIAADVYGTTPHIGRGGWTWYTGSAGWAFRVAIESVLGLRLEGGHTLVIKPCIPDEWLRYSIDYRLPNCQTLYRIDIINPEGCSAEVIAATVDGASLTIQSGEAQVTVVNDGLAHAITITLGQSHS